VTLDSPGEVTTAENISIVAGQLANLTRTVADLEKQVRELRERAENQQERSDQQRDRTEIQQERIDLAARELAEVSARLQAAADALRQAIWTVVSPISPSCSSSAAKSAGPDLEEPPPHEPRDIERRAGHDSRRESDDVRGDAGAASAAARLDGGRDLHAPVEQGKRLRLGAFQHAPECSWGLGLLELGHGLGWC